MVGRGLGSGSGSGGVGVRAHGWGNERRRDTDDEQRVVQRICKSLTDDRRSDERKEKMRT